MIVKRLGAIALAVILIGGAWLVRDRVIDDNGSSSGDDDQPRAGREIVCVEDLRDACETLAETLDLVVQIEDASVTVDALAALDDPSEAPVWITLEPFPEMVDSLRTIRGAPEFGAEQLPVASSRIALVIPSDRAPTLLAFCGDPIQWRCVGENAGQEWTTIDGDPAWRDVKPAFAPIDTALGLLGVAGAADGYFGATTIDVNHTEFLRWARRLANAVPRSTLTGGTPIATIEIRPSALDIAVGAEAELSDAAGSRFTTAYADPMIRADVVVAVPDGVSVPTGLLDDLRRQLVTEGRWDPPSTDENPLPSARDMLAIREAWRGFV
jgi:hypothetical protein